MMTMNKNMKILLFSALLFAAALSTAQAQETNARAARVGFGTLTATGTTSTFSVRDVAPAQHTIQANVSGSPATCSVQLEGRLDNSTFFSLSGALDCSGGNTMFHVVTRPIDYVRLHITALGGGSSPAVRLYYLGVH